MAKLYNLEAIALGDELKAIAFSKYPNLRLPTYGETAMANDDKETRVVGIRFPVELLDWIDSYSRISAVNRESRVTRNQTIISFLELMRATMQRMEQSDWGCSHQEMIQKVLNDATTTSNDTGGE